MARKVQIRKEIILEAAFEMLKRDGYAAINITRLAKEIGCSTQPIAWHFGNMENLREELLEYCLEFMKDRFVVKEDSAAGILESIAYGYVDLAMDYPNVYKYLYMSEQDAKKIERVVQELRAENHDKVIKIIEKEYGISAESADKYILNLQLYVHGIASYAVTRVSFSSKKDIMRMVHDANAAFINHLKK